MNQTTADTIKKKIKPLMPESAYNYFITWFNSLVSEPDGCEKENIKRLYKKWDEELMEYNELKGSGPFTFPGFPDWLDEEALVSEPVEDENEIVKRVFFEFWESCDMDELEEAIHKIGIYDRFITWIDKEGE